MRENPFFIRNLAADSIPHLREICVDRAEELNKLQHAIVDKRHNVLLYGERGVGKTFLIRLLEQEIRDLDGEVFPALINLASLSAYGNEDEVASFPRAVLLQFCKVLWTDLLKMSYLDLRERLDETGKELTLRREAERIVQRVYTFLMTFHKRARTEFLHSVGFSAAAKGEIREKTTSDRQQSDVLPFEFAEFAAELIDKVLKPKGKNRVVIICDDANLMPLYKQEAILERYLELFSFKRVQFLFVAGHMSWERKTYIPSCFETRQELKGFPKKEHIYEMIQKANDSSVVFSPEAVDLLYELLKGHPLYTIDACGWAYQYAERQGKVNIDAALMNRVCVEREERRKQYHEIIVPLSEGN